MADEKAISVDFVAGQLSAIQDLIAAHAQNSERRFDQVEDQLADQNKQHATDKAEAKRENEGRHAQNQSLWTATHALASKTDTWITEKGDPMHKAWMVVEQKKAERRLLNKGRAMTWAKIAGLAGLIVTVLGFLGREPLGALLKKIGEALS